MEVRDEQIKNRKKQQFILVNEHAAGIDTGPQFNVVAASPDRDPEQVQIHKTFTGQLYKLAGGGWYQNGSDGVNWRILNTTF